MDTLGLGLNYFEYLWSTSWPYLKSQTGDVSRLLTNSPFTMSNDGQLISKEKDNRNIFTPYGTSRRFRLAPPPPAGGR
jgi:hypothetical protein